MRIILSLSIALLLGACGAIGGLDPDGGVDDGVVTDPAPGPKGGAADGVLNVAPGIGSGPGISIPEAIGHTGPGPLLVNGTLFVEPDGRVLLCEAIAESFPPQCGGVRLEVRGLDVSSMPDLEEANGVRWAEQVQVLGTLAFVEN